MRSVIPARIIISTSRKPSPRTRSLCKELRLMLPAAIYIQRGKRSLDELLQASTEEGRILMMIGERRGNPGSLDLYSGEETAGPLLSVKINGVRLAREYNSRFPAPTKTLCVSTDMSENARRVSREIEKYLDVAENGERVLFIEDAGKGGFRLTFKEQKTGRELGPSITGVLRG